jgi:uncharacterized protein with von Willebrand factor type A (vWA) domain
MIEEMLLALLASPQLAVFFEKFPRLKNIIAADIPRWREAVRARLKEVNIPPDLDASSASSISSIIPSSLTASMTFSISSVMAVSPV